MEDETAITKTDSSVAMAPTFGPNMKLETLDSAWRFATAIKVSGLAPKGMEKAETILVAMQMGYEVGLAPLQAIQNIAVINGRPTLWGDSQLALVRASRDIDGSPLLEDYEEEEVGEAYNDDYGYKITLKRKGMKAATETFLVCDAKLAGLWGKAGPWTQYPRRMLKFRTRGFLLRDQFGDILKGLSLSREEAMDMPREINVTPTVGEDRPSSVEGMKGLLEEKKAEAPEPAPETEEPVQAKSEEVDPTHCTSCKGAQYNASGTKCRACGGTGSVKYQGVGISDGVTVSIMLRVVTEGTDLGPEHVGLYFERGLDDGNAFKGSLSNLTPKQLQCIIDNKATIVERISDWIAAGN